MFLTKVIAPAGHLDNHVCSHCECYLTNILSAASINVMGCQQLAQLLVCDWLLETRTAVWEEQGGSAQGPVSGDQLSAFQADVSSLCRITQELPVSGVFISGLILFISVKHVFPSLKTL